MKEIKGRAMHAKKTTIHSFLCETLEGYIIFTQYPWCKQHMNFGVNNKESKQLPETFHFTTTSLACTLDIQHIIMRYLICKALFSCFSVIFQRMRGNKLSHGFPNTRAHMEISENFLNGRKRVLTNQPPKPSRGAEPMSNHCFELTSNDNL